MATKLRAVAANDKAAVKVEDISPTSKELVIGLVGHAGGGASTAGHRLHVLLDAAGYTVIPIKLSALIINIARPDLVEIDQGANAGATKFERACALQNLGDEIRRTEGGYALAVAAIAQIKASRGGVPGVQKLAFILDSLKHPDEVKLLRQVYDHSFRLVAVHCDNSKREDRLIGSNVSPAKYGGVDKDDVLQFMKRDAKDDLHLHGQRVRDVFHLADFFLDNSSDTPGGAGMNADIERFVRLLLDEQLVRPTAGERAIYHAYAASLQSACLSRQVGAALMAADGTLLATGANDPPKFGGGIYDEDSKPDNRCFAWTFNTETGEFHGCHNDRKKHDLYGDIAAWMAKELSASVAKELVPVNEVMGKDLSDNQRRATQELVRKALAKIGPELSDMPGVKDAIEYSRAIHAEMTALLAAARAGAPTSGASLYVTTYPCHNCARHLVAAGVSEVFFIEPYVKSLATELHSDAIATELPQPPAAMESAPKQTRMVIVPFTGVGPRMYEDFFIKRGQLKGDGGKYDPKKGGVPFYAVRLRELEAVESEAVNLIPGFEPQASSDE